ncbi:molybdopterin-dependent oxidoreductase [Chloroflexota bacterium]
MSIPEKPTRCSNTKRSRQTEWRKGLCGICPAGCWVEVATSHGKLVGIKRDTEHSLGMLCRLGEHAPEIVYSQHRLKYPMRRVGARGSHNFERIGWDEAYHLIVDNLIRIREHSGPEAVAIYTGRGAQELSLCDMFQPRNIAVSSASNVLFPFGSPNTTGVGALCYVALHMIAPYVTMGRMQINMFAEMPIR